MLLLAVARILLVQDIAHGGVIVTQLLRQHGCPFHSGDILPYCYLISFYQPFGIGFKLFFQNSDMLRICMFQQPFK